jgi:hypothetical protein
MACSFKAIPAAAESPPSDVEANQEDGKKGRKV